MPRSEAPPPLMRRVRGPLAVAVVLQALGAAAGVVPFVAVAELARVLTRVGAVDRAAVWTVVAVAAGALVVRLVLVGVASALTHLAENEVQLDLRRRLVDKLGRVPLGWFDGRGSGAVETTVQEDVAALHHLVAHSMLELTTAVVVPVVSVVYLFSVDWRMTLVTLAPLVVGLTLFRRTGAVFLRRFAAIQPEMVRIHTTAAEFAQGIAVVKTYGRARAAYQRFATAAERYAAAFDEFVGGLVRPRAVAELVLSPVTVLVVVLAAGSGLVVVGQLPAVDLVPFAVVGVSSTSPLLTLSHAEQEVHAGRGALARIRDVLAATELPVPTAPRRPADDRVVFDGVDFSYDGETPVLDGIDLVLEPGTVTAVVGPSGAGKSTLATLLPRFADVDAGAVRIGGVDVREIAPAELYRHVSFVLQDVRLLRDTVAGNIRLGRPDADDAEVERVARAACVHDRILALPRGYDSVVGDDAVFSGGEAQRVSVARALLVDAPLVVLDEAASYADPESEAQVQTALSRLCTGRTLLVIAHRLPTVAGADQIVVLDHGRVVERGRHAELLAAGGTYARLWRAQHSADLEGATG